MTATYSREGGGSVADMWHTYRGRGGGCWIGSLSFSWKRDKNKGSGRKCVLHICTICVCSVGDHCMLTCLRVNVAERTRVMSTCISALPDMIICNKASPTPVALYLSSFWQGPPARRYMTFTRLPWAPAHVAHTTETASAPWQQDAKQCHGQMWVARCQHRGSNVPGEQHI